MPDSSRYAYRRHDDAFAPTREDLAGLRDHVRTWAEALGIRIRAVEAPEDIEDEALRAQFSKRRRVKGWYDSSADEVCVYLPNIALDVRNAYGLLDRTLLHEIVGHKGLMGLLGRERFAAYCDALWGKMSEPLRQRFIMYVDGDEGSQGDRRAAAAEFVAHAAEDLEGPDWERAHGRWGFAMKVLSETFPELAEITSIPENISYDALAKALRFLGKAREYKMPEVSIDELSDAVDHEIDALDGQFRGIVRRDYDKTIRLGRIFPAILNSSERSRDLPMELRTNAFFGSEYDDKQERHPFRASDLHGIVKGLRKPLAVFVSKQKDKPDTTVVLLPNTSSASGEPKHFVAILTPIENRDGVPVMNIDSVYPKRDRDLVRWIGTSYTGNDGKEKAKLLRYMGEGFFKWFADVSERLLNESERDPETIKSHSERQSNSAEVGVRLTDQTDDSRRIRAELLRATNIVIYFDNPKIPGEKFRIFHKEDSELAREVEEVRARTLANGTFMTAPDGTPTDLSEDEWLLAHTSAFRRMYGDWEGYLLDGEIRKNGINSVSLHLLDNLLAYYETTGEDILERIPPEALRSDAQGDGAAVAASLLVRGDGSADSSHSLGEQYPELGRQGLRQESTLESWAKGLGIWFDDTDTAFIDNTLKDGGFIGEGNEAKVWYGGENTVTKAISLRNYVCPQHALDRILLHNYHFPETRMAVTGFGRDSRGNFQIVVSQPFVRGERMSFSEINTHVRSLGFGPAGRHHEPRERQDALLTTAHTTDKYFLGDLHVANVLKTPGGPAVIDSEMRLNTPGLGYGGNYVIPERKASFSLTEKREPKAFDVQKVAYALGLTEDFRNIYFAKDEDETESSSIENGKMSREFDEALDKLARKELPEDYLFNLGLPSPYLLSTGFANVPMLLRPSTLNSKSLDRNHPYSPLELKGLVKAMYKPWIVFSYGDRKKAQNVIVGIEHENKHFLVGVSIVPNVKDRVLEINSIRNVFPKDDIEWLRWIQQGKTLRIDNKEKIQAIINMQDINHPAYEDIDLDLIAKIVNNFENPTLEDLSFDLDRNIEFKPSPATKRLNDLLGVDGYIVYEDLTELRRMDNAVSKPGIRLSIGRTRVLSSEECRKKGLPDKSISVEVTYGERHADMTLMPGLRLQEKIETEKLKPQTDGLFKANIKDMAENNTPVRYYSGNISSEPGVVFVFGSNPEGRHGAGAAKVARERFGAVYGRGEGLQGDAYAIPTKDLGGARRLGIYSSLDSRWEEMKRTVLEAYANRSGDFSTLFTDNPYPRSVSPEAIVGSIMKMYGAAEASPERTFAVAYTNGATEFSMNGYCGAEMAEMFSEAGRRFGRIPGNVAFSENWKGLIHAQTAGAKEAVPDMGDNGHRNLVNDLAFIEKKENKNIDIMPRQKITFTTSDSTTYRQRTVDNAQATDITLAFAVDFSTAGERATKTAAGGKYYPVSIDGAVTPRQVASGIEDALVSAFGRADAKQPRTLNIAGNGLATLSSRGMTQERVNTLLYEALRIVTADGYRITSVRSGGQTGIDEAGIYAAARLGIPARVHTTRDWKWRAEDGADRKGEADFKARYDYIEQLESVKDVEARSLVNDLATEIAVGGDRFTPWDIAPRIASAVSEDGRQAFRDAVRLRYLETTPDDLHDEKALAFLEDQINLWASDEQFALGRAILGMDLSDDELVSAQRFRFVSPGVIAVSWDAGKEGATRDILFTRDGERINDGFILSDGAPGWEVGKDGILRATATVSEGRDAATLRRRDERQAVRVNAETGEVLEGRRTYRVFHGASGRNYAEERAVWAKIAALNGSEPSFNAFAKISEGVFSGYRMTGPATGEEVLFDADGYSLIGDAVIPTVPGPNRQQHGWGVRGGIIVARSVDGAGGEHEVRIDARTGKALALGEDRGAGVEPEDRRRAAAPPARENDLPSLYTLGLGRRSAKNFRSHIPKGTDVIIDARHYTTNENAPHFDATAIRATASGKGAAYEWHPELSGVPADRESKRRVRPLVSEVNVADDPKVVDYDRYAQTPEFRDGLERIEALVNEGKRVLVISGETDPAKCARGRLIGQALLRDGIRAVHIDDKNNLPRIRYQEDVVADAMRGSALVAGGPVDVGFLSNGKFNLHPGARVRRADVSTPASERIITDAAMDNYSNPVQFAESAEANPLNVVRENAAASDFTVVFTSMRGSASERAAVDAAGKVSSIKFYIPENREDLYDPERIARDAQRIMKKIRWAVASRPDGAVDMQSLRLNVQGSDMPHISARRVEGQVTNEELEKRRRDLGFRNETAGYKLDDMSGISQDDVNEYIYGILSYIQNAREVNAEFAEGEEPGQTPADIRIGTVLTDGNTGVAEAATLAAQRLQLRPLVQAPKGWRLTYDNETLMGREVRDEAMFKNRFRIGLAEENGLTAEQIDARAREADFRRAQGEDGMTPGLTDTQVAALHFLGYPNEQIIDMVDIAKDNAVVIDGPDSMLDFLESCAGYGICGADRLSTEKIREAFDYTADLVRRSLDKGINLVTVVSPDYPAGLRDMADYDIGDATPVYAVNNGVLSASMEGTRHRQTRPAILWVRGNLNLSDRPGVSAIGGGRWSEGDAVRTGEALGAGLAEQDVALIANLFTGPQRAAVEAALEKGGQVTMLANGPIGGEETSDVEQKVVENDGAVISEDSIDEKPRTLDRNEKDRRNRISVALGAAAALIDHVNRLDATAVGELSAYTVGGMYFAVSAIIKNASKGKETIDEQGNGVEELANAAKGVSPEEKAQKAVAASDPEYLREVEGELFPSQFTVPEIITPEGRRIFFIHEANYPEVVKALHDAYGDDILLENPRRYNEVLRRASLRTVEYGGGQVNLIGEEESTGTRIALPEPRESRVHFVNGAVYSTLTAPEFTTGLASRPARAEAAQLFERFQKEAVRIQNGLLAAVGLSGAPSVRFSNAYHITVSPEKVDVWHGEDLAASVKIGANGTVRVNDVEGTFFGMERPVLTEGTLNSMVNTLELWVLGKGPDRSEQYNLADREIRDEMDKNEESGYYEQLADNLETASRDVEEAVAKGRILDASDLGGDAQKAAKGLAFPKERAVALLLRERTAIEEKIAEVAKRQAVQEKAVEGAQLNYDNAVNAAAGSAQTSYAQDMLQAEKAKLEAVASERADLEKRRGWILLDIGSVANADRVQRIPGEKEDADTVTLYVDGRRVRTGNARLSAEEKAAGKSELEALRGGYRIYAGKDDVEFRKGLNAETRTLEYEAVPKGQAPAGGRKADTSEIIGDYVNGYYIVEREGKKAYADKHFNICSAWYDDLTPMGITCGCAKLTGPDGKQTLNMIRRDGCTPVLETWVDGIAVPQDGVAVVSKDGLFNYLNLETGELLFDEWKTEAYRFSNGWGVYRQGSDDFHPGTYMYVNREGLVVTDQIGYDACEDMKPEGAVAWSNGEAHRISPEGDDLGVVKVDFDVDTTEKLNEGRKGFTLKDLFFGQKK